ncbi:hypothetical protein GCM10010994_12110 [Chelatococcus reniformis]|uniref:Peptidoglycan binding-like domain-containing protein n=2 Tax=Chelatococcus reniformis TaxID=1494448 RepID=A0A916U0C4_9HYPH|nr:hypothetical protein GCM10010994_12110 [Chelatococcus reniformis]
MTALAAQAGAGRPRRTVARGALACAMLVLAGGVAGAQIPAAAPTGPNPKLEASRKAFEALPETERKSIQDALVWAGTYNGVTDGSFGKRTYDAITTFETRAKLTADGILAPQERAHLAHAATRAREAVVFRLVTDPVSGIRIGLPTRVLDKSSQARSGTVYASSRDRTALALFVADPAATLPELFDKLGVDGPPTRRVSYKVLRPDFLVVTGTDSGRRFFTRIAKGEAGLRGFTFTYPDDAGAAFDKLTIAITNSFDPFPARPSGGTAPTPAAPPAPVAQTPAGPRLVGTGLIVAPGRVLTTAAAAAECPAPLIGRARAQILRSSAESGLALLEAGAAKAAPVAPASREPAAGDSLAVAGFAEAPAAASGGPSVPTLGVASATVATEQPALRIIAPLQAQAGGSPVVDRRGQLVGIVAAAAAPRRIAGVVPQTSYAVVPAATIAAFLTAAGVAPAAAEATADGLTAGTIAAAWAPALVAVECGPTGSP